MNSLQLAAEIIQEAEASLRELVSKAATSGDYAGVLKITSWAQAIGGLVKKAPNAEAAPISAPAAKNKKKPLVTKDDYPQFYRQGDQLIRIAWSKKEKKEYQHKAPQVVLRSLAKAMAEVGKDGRVFATDTFLPISDADGAEIPAYQAYVGIALLKQTALIDQHGRQGYSIPRVAEFKEAVEAVWQKLPEH